MTNKKLVDKALDDILFHAAPIAESELMEESAETFLEEVIFSDEHKMKMQKLFKAQKCKRTLQKLTSYSKRVAVVFLIMVITATISIVSVQAWRIKVLNFILEISNTHSDINFNEVSPKESSYKTEDITFDYIPSDFKLDTNKSQNDSIYMLFVKEKSYFNINIRHVTSNMSIDTENAAVKKLIINGQEALLSKNDNVAILVWHNEKYSFTLTGNIEESELVKIAENIKN